MSVQKTAHHISIFRLLTAPCSSTTNHLDRLDPALSRPGRMDVWIEFKNASKWQAELLFKNFFPSADEDNVELDGDLDGIDLPVPPSPSAASSSGGSSSLFSMPSYTTSPSDSSISLPATASSTKPNSPSPLRVDIPKASVEDLRSSSSYLPPSVEEEIAAYKHSSPPLDGATLARLATKFADSIPDEEFSVAALQGCKSRLRPSPSLISSLFLSLPS